jgi:hypothetical protein
LVIMPLTLRAHVAPAVNENNRYLTLSPLADRVRLSYTVFFGQVPGLEARLEMDRDSDAELSKAEQDRFASDLGTLIAEQLQVSIDDQPIPVIWSKTHVGLGEGDDGAFSIDFVAELCVDGDAGAHTVTIRDGFEIDKPGEGELKLELGPGIEVVRSGVGDARGKLDPKVSWQGQAGPLRDPGYLLEFRAAAGAFAPDQPCEQLTNPPEIDARVRRLWLYAGLGALLATIAALAIAIRAARRRKPKAPGK